MRLGVRGVLFWTCLVFGTDVTALGQSVEQNTVRCGSANPDDKIAGCTALLKTDQHTNPNRAVIYGNRGVGYYSKGEYDLAIQDADQAIHLSPTEPSFYYTRGMAFKKKAAYDQAISNFDEAIRLNPKFERAYYDRGNSYIDKGEYDRAIVDFNDAIRLNPGNARNYNNRGVAHLMNCEYSAAISDDNQAIHLDSNNPVSYFNRGAAYFAESNPTAAIADFEHTISSSPSSSAAVAAAPFLHVAMKEQDRDDSRQLARVAATADLSKWPGPVLKLDLGQMTAGEVMAAAASGIPTRQRWQLCEANYFVGKDALFHHQRTTALVHLKAARDGCPKGDTVYPAALSELKAQGAPSTRRK